MSTPTAALHAPASDLLTTKYRLPLLVGLLESWLTALDELDALAASLPVELLSIDDAVGVQLDALRRLVGADQVAPDSALRATIRAEVLARKSSGGVNDLLAVLDALFAPGQLVPLEEIQPAEVQVGPIYSTTAEVAGAVLRQLLRAKSGGVKLELSYSTVAEGSVFSLSSQLGVTESSLSTGLGLSSTSNGGQLAGLA